MNGHSAVQPLKHGFFSAFFAGPRPQSGSKRHFKLFSAGLQEAELLILLDFQKLSAPFRADMH